MSTTNKTPGRQLQLTFARARRLSIFCRGLKVIIQNVENVRSDRSAIHRRELTPKNKNNKHDLQSPQERKEKTA